MHADLFQNLVVQRSESH